MNTTVCLNDLMRKDLRKLYNVARWTSIKITKLFIERFQRTESNEKIALINVQYVNAFNELDMLCGLALKKRGYAFKAIVCPGLEYCEREDHQTSRPSYEECQRERKFVKYFPDYFEEKISFYDLHDAIEKI